MIGTTSNHRVADGQAMSAFFVAWGKAVRGMAIDPLPDHDLSWLTPRCPPRTEFDHWEKEFIGDDFSLRQIEVEPDLITNILLHYSPDFITKLKTSISEKRSTFEVLLGHLWRKITIARGLDEDELAMVKLTVNGRQRLRPPVAKEFFGNVVLYAYPKAKVRELVDGGLVGAARIIHEAVAVIGEDYFRSFMDFGAIHGEEELVPIYDVDGNVLSPNIEVDSWLGLEFQEVDFGGGGALCGFLPTWVPEDGFLIMLPSLCPDGGIDIVVCLLEQNAKKLKEISHSLG